MAKVYTNTTPFYLLLFSYTALEVAYVILGSTVVGAVLTPSVDPLTQLLMSSIVLFLYFGGVGVVLLLEKK